MDAIPPPDKAALLRILARDRIVMLEIGSHMLLCTGSARLRLLRRARVLERLLRRAGVRV